MVFAGALSVLLGLIPTVDLIESETFRGRKIPRE